MPKLSEYLGVPVFFFAGTRPWTLYRALETKAEIITGEGRVVSVRLGRVSNRRPLTGIPRKHFIDLVNAKAEDILKKWNDVFVLNKVVKPEIITRRIKK